MGHQLAAQLGMKYLDTDELIEKTEKMTIDNIFAKKGEPYFRQLETEVVKTLEDYDNFVIAPGGGMVLRQENVKMLKAIGPLILLWADPGVIYERTKGQTHRPLLNVPDPKAEIKKILAKREPVYKQAADFIVNTAKLDVEEVVARIIDFVKTGDVK